MLAVAKDAEQVYMHMLEQTGKYQQMCLQTSQALRPRARRFSMMQQLASK